MNVLTGVGDNARRLFLPGDLESWAEHLMEKAGLPAGEAHIVANHLVEANLRGVDSHGISRMGIYVKRLELGLTA